MSDGKEYEAFFPLQNGVSVLYLKYYWIIFKLPFKLIHSILKRIDELDFNQEKLLLYIYIYFLVLTLCFDILEIIMTCFEATICYVRNFKIQVNL